MKHNKVSKGGLFILGVLCLAFMAPVFAGKDDLYVSNVNAVTVGGISFASSSTSPGNNRQLTITNPIVGAKAVSVQVTWGIAAGSSPRTTTFPNNSVTFTAITSVGTSVGAIGVSPATCDFETDLTTCSSTVTFTTPNVTDTNIQVKISPNPPSKSPANKELTGKNLFINFGVTAQVAKLDTALTVPDPQCFKYKAGNVDLTATLTELVNGLPISGGTVGFSVDSNLIGSDFTDSNGDAILSYNINGLSVGDHNLFAEFAGDATYNP
ncbi:MAG: Ig-like domain-containing protein, partial [Methylobacter sp.]|nr:Ig-like domain-containing protein [Methylobacter sp.]